MRLILCLIGENLQNNIGIDNFVNFLMKTANFIPDPPDEFNWNIENEERDSKFGVVEFTTNTSLDNRTLYFFQKF